MLIDPLCSSCVVARATALMYWLPLSGVTLVSPLDGLRTQHSEQEYSMN